MVCYSFKLQTLWPAKQMLDDVQKGFRVASKFKDRYLPDYLLKLKVEAIHGFDPSVFWPQVNNNLYVLENLVAINSGNHPYIFGSPSCIPFSATDYYSGDPLSLPNSYFSDKNAIVLKSLNNYGHALWDTVGTLLLTAQEALLPELRLEFVKICLPTWNKYVPMWLNALELDLMSSIHYATSSVSAGRLWVGPGNYFVSQPSYISLILFLIDWFRNHRSHFFEYKPRRNVFMTRGPIATRILNYDSVIKMVSSAGYETIHESTLSTSEIRDILCSSANIIIEPGAGSANLIFSHPDARIASLIPSFIYDNNSGSAYRTSYSTFYAYSYRNSWFPVRGNCVKSSLKGDKIDLMKTAEEYDLSEFLGVQA